jgi:L,D-transpeptidase ErfK/SrfK
VLRKAVLGAWAALLLNLGAADAAEAPPSLIGSNAQRDDLIGRLHVTSLTNTRVADLARQFDLSTPSVLLANPGLDAWAQETRSDLILPTAHLMPKGARAGLLVNRAEFRIYYFQANGTVTVWPISVGKPGVETPLGKTAVMRKTKFPTWFPTPETRRDYPELPAAVPPGPDNPLGTRAMYLGWPTYLIHGTNDDYGIGQPYTRGCVRLFPEDIEKAYELVPVGTKVEVTDQPVKLGWHGGELFMETQADGAQLHELIIYGAFTPKPAPDVKAMIESEAGDHAPDIAWGLVTAILEQPSGLPVQITNVDSHPVDITEGKLLALRGPLGIGSPERGLAADLRRLDAPTKAAREHDAQERLREHKLRFPYDI